MFTERTPLALKAKVVSISTNYTYNLELAIRGFRQTNEVDPVSENQVNDRATKCKMTQDPQTPEKQ